MYKSLRMVKRITQIVLDLNANYVLCGYKMEGHLHLYSNSPLAPATWMKFIPQTAM